MSTSHPTHPDADRGPHRAAMITVGLLMGFLVVALLWMGLA